MFNNHAVEELIAVLF